MGDESSQDPTFILIERLTKVCMYSIAYKPSLVRLQCLLLLLYRMVLPVLNLVQYGIGRFCFCFLAKVSLVRRDF